MATTHRTKSPLSTVSKFILIVCIRRKQQVTELLNDSTTSPWPVNARS
jgi:hypothetical protein